VRTTPNGQVLCESCFAATGGDPSRSYWQGAGQVPPGQVPPFYVPSGGPNPSVAAVLGLIPGVGAMYNGQLFKGLIHVVIFAVLVSITEHYGVFGIFIGAWCLYQSFEAFHTAKARRDGQPLPDPFGLNELGSWLNLGGKGSGNVPPGSNPPPPPTGGYAQTEPPPYSAPYTSSWSGTEPGYGPGAVPGAGGVPPQPPYAEPYAGANPGVNPGPYAENYPPGQYPPEYAPPIPPIPPVPPYNWRRREPIGAVVLIGLGLIFLLHSMGIVGHIFRFTWPVLLIGFGIWLIIRRLGYTQGGSK
jgi:hypothetical protein